MGGRIHVLKLLLSQKREVKGFVQLSEKRKSPFKNRERKEHLYPKTKTLGGRSRLGTNGKYFEEVLG